MNKPDPDLSSLLPDDATLKTRRAVLLDAVGASKATFASPAWRRAPRLALGGAVIVIAVAGTLIAGAGSDGTPAAYAVEKHPGGGVNIKIFSLGEPQGVERALREAGIASQVTYLQPGMTCREPHYTPSMAMLRTLQGHPQPQPWAGFNYESSEGPLTISIGDYRQRREMNEEIRAAGRKGDSSAAEWPSFVIDPTGLRPDQTVIMSSSPTPPGYQQPVPPNNPDRKGIKTRLMRQEPIDNVGEVRIAEGNVDPCEPVPASNGETPVRAPAGGWRFNEAPYAGWGFGPGFRAPNGPQRPVAVRTELRRITAAGRGR